MSAPPANQQSVSSVPAQQPTAASPQHAQGQLGQLANVGTQPANVAALQPHAAKRSS